MAASPLRRGGHFVHSCPRTMGSTGESPSAMMRNVTWASQGSRKETQCLLELLEKQNFPPTSPSRWGLSPFTDSLAHLHPGAGEDARLCHQGRKAQPPLPKPRRGASGGPRRAIRLRGRRISAGLSNNGLQPPGSLGYWKHMFVGEKEKKQLNFHAIAVSRRVRETRAHGWRGSGGGHGEGAPRRRHPKRAASVQVMYVHDPSTGRAFKG